VLLELKTSEALASPAHVFFVLQLIDFFRFTLIIPDQEIEKYVIRIYTRVAEAGEFLFRRPATGKAIY
jgi:hypothetical protein